MRRSDDYLSSNNTNTNKEKKTMFPSNKEKKLKKIKLTKDNIYFPKRNFLITNPPNLLYIYIYI
jgi:hypothetical protein